MPKRRATTREIRCAWEIYAVTELQMGAGEAIGSFNDWADSLKVVPPVTDAEIDAAADSIARARGYVQGACLEEHYRDARVALAAAREVS